MTPDSIILLDANARLTHLIDQMNQALDRAKSQCTEQAWDMHVAAWERLLDELMHQVDQPVRVPVDIYKPEPECDDRGPQD